MREKETLGLEIERVRALALWAWGQGADPGLARRTFEGPAALAEERLARLLTTLPTLGREAAEEFRHLLTAPLEALYPERPLAERVEYALTRYRTYYRHEAPKGFRAAYPPDPTPEGVLALGRLKGYWREEEEQEARALIGRLLEVEG